MPDQTGSVQFPFSTVQAGVDAGFTALYITGDFSPEVVVAGALLYLTGPNTGAAISGLTIPDGGFVQLNNVAIFDAITGGDGCTVITNLSIGSATLGLSGFLVMNGPGPLNFPAKVDQSSISNVNMDAGGTFLASGTVISTGSSINADVVELFQCTSVAAAISCVNLNAQSCILTSGNYTTTGIVVLQDTRAEAAVSFINALGQEFQVDGFTNYWLKTNGVSFSNAGEKVVTEDLTP